MPAAGVGHAWGGPLHPGGVGCSWKRPQEKEFDLGGRLWTVGPLPGRMAEVHIWKAGRDQQALQIYINKGSHWNRGANDYRICYIILYDRSKHWQVSIYQGDVTSKDALVGRLND